MIVIVLQEAGDIFIVLLAYLLYHMFYLQDMSHHFYNHYKM